MTSQFLVRITGTERQQQIDQSVILQRSFRHPAALGAGMTPDFHRRFEGLMDLPDLRTAQMAKFRAAPITQEMPRRHPLPVYFSRQHHPRDVIGEGILILKEYEFLPAQRIVIPVKFPNGHFSRTAVLRKKMKTAENSIMFRQFLLLLDKSLRGILI